MAFPNTLFPLIPLHTEVITNEEYKLFHTIDIMLVKKLIHSFNRTSNDAIDVVAFLLWLEREKLSVSAVNKVLKEWPNHLVGILVEQIVALLKWLRNTDLVWERRGDIFLIQELCHRDAVTFMYLYQRRLEILEGKNRIKSEMTERAFGEMFQESDNRNVQDGVRNIGDGARNDPREWIHGNQSRIQFGSIDAPRELESDFAAGSFVHFPQTVRTFVPDRLQYATNHNLLRFGTTGDTGGGFANVASSNNGRILPNIPYGPRMRYMETNGQIQGSDQGNTRRPVPESELSMLLRGLSIEDEETEVPEDDRTVFLTFSRGYPLTEPEIWGFFTRRFGNFIKEIHFEEVFEGEQPLYARLVVWNSSIIPLICGVNVRTKYVINGRHVWAKKYVRKHNAPPPSRVSSSESTSQQPDAET